MGTIEIDLQLNDTEEVEDLEDEGDNMIEDSGNEGIEDAENDRLEDPEVDNGGADCADPGAVIKISRPTSPGGGSSSSSHSGGITESESGDDRLADFDCSNCR